MPTGRPSTYSAKIANAICEAIADGKSLRSVCAKKGMPAKGTVMVWLRKYPRFQDQYARARELQADSHVDEIIDIADTEEDPQRARVRIDARKWSASKMRPKKYGDKLELSGDENAPLNIKVTIGGDSPNG